MRILDIDFAGQTAKSHRGEMKIELPKPRIANRSGDTVVALRANCNMSVIGS